MPIQAPTTVTGPAAGEFKETTAAYRKTGPVEKYAPVSQHVRGLILNGLGPMVPRVDELTREGKMVTTSTLRAAEVAAKIQRGNEELAPSEVAQALIATREALEIGVEDPDSPYYQRDIALRTQRERELNTLNNELNGYLTGEARKPEDVTRNVQRWRLPFRRAWPPLQSLRHQTTETEKISPPEDRQLKTGETAAAKKQSRITEGYNNARARITRERYGTRPFATLNLAEKRAVSYATSEELSRQFDDGRGQEILDEVTKGASKDLIEDALENGSDAEKRFARRVQKIEDDRSEMLRKAKQLGTVKKMSEFQRFLVVDDSTLSQTEIADAMVKKLGIANEQEAAKLKSDPDKAYARFSQEAGPLGTITFTGELFRTKLEQFAENRGVTPKPGERIAGEPPTNLSSDALLGLTPQALAIELVDNKLTADPLKYLQEQGVPADKAQAMLNEAVNDGKFATKNPDGTYSLNHDKLGEWGDVDLAVLQARGTINIEDAAFRTSLENKMGEFLKTKDPKYADDRERAMEIGRKINNIRDLARIKDRALSPEEQKRIITKWGDKRSLALLVLLLGPLSMTSIVNSMPTNEQRSFQNMFA